MQDSDDGSSIFKNSDENESGDDDDMEEIFNEKIPESTIEKIKNKIKSYD